MSFYSLRLRYLWGVRSKCGGGDHRVGAGLTVASGPSGVREGWTGESAGAMGESPSLSVEC